MRSRNTRLRGYVAVLAGLVTVAGLIVAAAGPAQAAPAPAGKTTPNYQPVSCNTTQKKDFAQNFARCFSMVRTTLAGQAKAAADAPPASALTPAQIQDAYSLPADAGQGQLVGIVDAAGDSHAEDDLAVFRSQFGLPPCTSDNGCFQKVDQNGGTDYPPDDAGWALETSLDLDAVSAACPNCRILLVEGSGTTLESLGIAVDTAVSLGAKYVSNSYGINGGEDPQELQLDHYYDHPGVAVTASSGDTGNVNSWPATSPTVTAVGGTTLTQDSSARGWHETAWSDAGSGCSPYEPRPDYQQDIDTNCPDNKATADISAVADPNTGLAVYDTIPYQGQSGWFQVGGTSLSSPLVASMYALAGTPVPGTYPVNYPYDAPQGLNDVTEGSNGSCGNVLCTAGPGWDGPTGLGTPNGVSSLTTGPHGDIAGTVTDHGSGAPISGATVKTPDGASATTEADGSYDLSVPVGTYDVTAQAFGYQAKTTTGVAVTDGHTTALDVKLTSVPSHNLSGTVTDGSGHGWPLYAKITIDGYPGGAVYTNPFNGHYSVDLPQGTTYALHVTPMLQGYVTKDLSVALGSADKVANAEVAVDENSCLAPGYGYTYDGTGASFAGWTGTTPKDGWTEVDNKGNGQVWAFDNPGGRTVPPGGDAQFAIIDSDHYGPGNSQDASLVSPVADLSDQTAPELSFDTFYNAISNQVADVDLSLDSGATWSNVWHQTTTDVSGHVAIPIPQAAGKTGVQVRFHYTGSFGWWWAVDNVIVGTRSCVAQHGGLVAGLVHDNNTGDPINGAKVASGADVLGVSAATPDDANLSDGFYWLFDPHTGSQQFTATDGKYTPASATVNVAANFVTRQDWTLEAGHLTVTPGSVSVTERLGGVRSRNVKLSNDGTQPVHVKVSEQNGSFTPMGQTKPAARMAGAPATVTKHSGPAYMGAMTLQSRSNRSRAVKPADVATPADAPWTSIADYPTAIVDNAAAASDEGTVYSVGGYNGAADLAKGWAYNASSQAWTPIADAPVAVEQAKASFAGGKVYLTGGWVNGDATKGTYAYDPSANSWTKLADMPTAVSASGSASLDGQVYSIGGCTTGLCSPATNAAARFDPASNAWTPIAPYPVPVAFPSCAGVSGEVVCAGGVNANTNENLKSTYAYDPGADAWTKVADMPIALWGSVYSGANGKLQVATGSLGAGETNQAFEYDPSANTWTALPNANNTLYRGAGGCGLYQVGGGNFNGFGVTPHPYSEVLPGYDQCGKTDVPWLSESTNEFDLAPGQSTTVSVTMDSSFVPQPGAYTARLGIGTDTPYSVPAVSVTMHVNPPRMWGKITGAVTSAADGTPIKGATVQIGTFGGTGQVAFTLKTDTTGHYQLWLDSRYSPLQVIAAKDGFQPQVRRIRIHRGSTVIGNFALKKI